MFIHILFLIQLPESTTEPLKTTDLQDTFENVTLNCNLNEIKDNFMKITNKMQLNMENGTVVAGILCGEEKSDQMKHFISESASTLTKCIDPNYLNHIDK